MLKKVPKVKKKRRPNKDHPLPPGRPDKFDLIKEAEDLLAWASKDNSTSLYEFTYHKDYLAQELTDFAIREPKFALALKKAKERIAINREGGCNRGTLNYGVWHRSAHMYDKILDESEETKKDRAAERKKMVDKCNNENLAILLKKAIDGDIGQKE